MGYNAFSRQSDSQEEWKLVDRFDSAYWSGLDVQIYADNFLIEEAIQVNYVISEQVRPYYGYSSYIPDRIFHGTRIIQGELSLNFKRDAYLFSLLHKLRDQSSTGPNLPSNPVTRSEVKPPIPAAISPWGPQVWEKVTTQGLDPKIAAELVARKKAETNENIVEKFSADIQGAAGMFETRLKGFDLNIIFGANLNAAKTLRFLTSGDYDIQDGSPSYYDGAVVPNVSKQDLGVGTGIKLIGVEIMGFAKNIADDGRPIIETYTFQAKNVQVLKSIETSLEDGEMKSIIKGPGQVFSGDVTNSFGNV